MVFIPGLAPLVVKKQPYFDDPSLLRWTREKPGHEAPGAIEGEGLAGGTDGGRPAGGFIRASAERERQRPGEEVERVHG